MNKTKVTNKLVCFGVYGMTTFQGVKFGVPIELMQKHIPFVSDVNNMAHHTNLDWCSKSNYCLLVSIIISPITLIGLLKQASWLNSWSAKITKISRILRFIGFLCCHLSSGS
jgi:hypothetical protein